MSRNARLLTTLAVGAAVAGMVLFAVVAIRMGSPPGEEVIARVEGLPIHQAEFDVGLLFWEESVRVNHLDAHLVERYGEDVATLANPVMGRTARVAWDRLREPGHFVVETDLAAPLNPERAVEERRAIIEGDEIAMPGNRGRLLAQFRAAGEEAYWSVVVPNEIEDNRALIAFTRMRGFEGFEVGVELARIALDLDIEATGGFEGRASEEEVRAYLADFVADMPEIIEEHYGRAR